MSNEVILQDGSSWQPQATDEQGLLTELGACLSLSVENIRKAALIVQRYAALGFSKERLKSAVPPSILRSLDRIAQGTMLPETFMMLNGKIQESVSLLPVETQKRLCEGEPVEVHQPNGDVLRIPVDKLTSSQSKQVFSSGAIRGPAEQRKYIRDSFTPVRRRKEAGDEPYEPKSPHEIGDKIRRTSQSLQELLGDESALTTEAISALAKLAARINQLVGPRESGQNVAIAHRIAAYLDTTGPMTPAALSAALKVPEDEVLKLVESNKRQFVTNGKEIALVGQRI